MPLVRVGIGVVVAYLLLVLLAWVFQERVAFPAPRGAPPDPKRVGFAAQGPTRTMIETMSEKDVYLEDQARFEKEQGAGTPTWLRRTREAAIERLADKVMGG